MVWARAPVLSGTLNPVWLIQIFSWILFLAFAGLRSHFLAESQLRAALKSSPPSLSRGGPQQSFSLSSRPEGESGVWLLLTFKEGLTWLGRPRIRTSQMAWGKESTANAGAAGDVSSIPGVRKIPWRRQWQSTPVFFPGKSHGQRSLVAYSP